MQANSTVARSTVAQHRYPSMAAFLRDVKRGNVPEDLVSPGFIAARAGITRQAVHKAIDVGRLESWHVEGGYVFVRVVDAVNLWR